MRGTRSNRSKRNSNSGYRRKQWNVWVVLRLYYGSRLFLFTEFSFRYYCSSLEDVVIVVWKLLSRTWGSGRQNMWLVNPFVENKETALSHKETLQLIELSSNKWLKSTFNSMSSSKFWIKMKNEYLNLREIATRFLLCFSTTYPCQTAFSAMTA